MRSFSDELYHHGIKGMKWGVRRTPEQLGHKVSKRNYKKGIYARPDSEDISIPKGTKLYRMSYNTKDSSSSGTYVTRTQMDRNFYKNTYGKSLMAIGEKGLKKSPLYEQSFKTVEELKIPSFDTRKASMSEVFSNKKLRSQIGKEVATNFVTRSSMMKVSDISDAKKLAKTLDATSEQKKILETAIKGAPKNAKMILAEIDNKKEPVLSVRKMSEVISGSETARSAYIGILKKKGYNATVDDFGRKGLYRTAGETSEALIVFDIRSSAPQMGAKVISPQKSSSLSKKVILTDWEYDAKVLGDKQSAEQLQVYGQLQTKKLLNNIGGMALSVIVTPIGGMTITSIANQNAALKADMMIKRLEEEKRRNWK